MSNNGGVYTWSKTATNNASADSTVNYQEGQAPSSLNDSARSAMASVAKWRDDISGSIVTTGTSAAYQVASNQNFDTLANFKGQTIAFTPHVTNAAGPVTMTVDGFANLPLRSAPSVELGTGVLVQGTPYLATCGTDGVLYLQNFYGASPYLIPLGGFLDYGGATAPNSNFALAYGQAISRTAYATLFGLFGTTFGPGDGTTTFNVPDLRGRVVAGKDDMGGSAAGRLSASFFASPTTLGGTGGSESRQLATSNLPPYTPSGTVNTGTLTVKGNFTNPASGSGTALDALQNTGGNATYSLTVFGGFSFTGDAQGGTSNAFGIVQPTIVLNKILRII